MPSSAPPFAPLRWGVLSTAAIGTVKVIPAMQNGRLTRVDAIASRNLDKAQQAADELGIARAYGDYESLLADPEIEAIYNPLPNHLHVPWSIKALEAGKHVLSEKPIGLTADEGQLLVDAGKAHPDLKLMEAFMYRHHPQWIKAKELAQDGSIGTLRTIQTFFSYFNNDPDNIRNMPEIGGGAMLDIGCYCVSLSQFLFDAEPDRALGLVERDPEMGTDRLASGILDFGDRSSTFTCSTQLKGFQSVNIVGTEGRIEILIPFNAPPNEPCALKLYAGDEFAEAQRIELPIADQYTIQGDLFAQSVLENTPVPTPISDGVANIRAIEAVMESGDTGSWVNLP